MKGQLFAFALGTLMLTACSNDDIFTEEGTNKSVAQFSATIDEPITRGTPTAWAANDAIGISGTSGATEYTNVNYVTTRGDGNFTPKNESETIYYQDDKTVNFTAYYPWNDLNGATTISADTWKQANQKTFDFLWAQAEGSKASNKVSFSFGHKMSQLTLTIKCGDDVSYEDVKAAILSLEGFKNNGSFDVVSGTATASGDASGKWTFANNTAKTDYNALYTASDASKEVKYDLIVFPQEFTEALPFYAEVEGQQTFKATLDFTSANAERDTNAKNEWVAGRRYYMRIFLNKTGITVEGCTINAWQAVDGGDVTAK